MKVRDIMTTEVETVRSDTILRHAAKKMKDLDVGLLPVMDGDRLKGMLTDRDITIRATAQGCDPTSTTVGEVMTSTVVSCTEDADLEDAARLMQQHQIRRLIVCDRHQRVVGIVSLGDVAVHGDIEQAADTLEQVSEPAQPSR